jgi:hypothetical protein
MHIGDKGFAIFDIDIGIGDVALRALKDLISVPVKTKPAVIKSERKYSK